MPVVSPAAIRVLAIMVLVALSATPVVLGAKRADLPHVTETPDGRIIAGARLFHSWREYVASDFFQEHGMRCATAPSRSAGFESQGSSPGDCTFNLTNPSADYDPSVARYRIPVVVHVIQSASGAGLVDEHTVREQIDILNEDYLAIYDTNGEFGTDVQIEFQLATVDPDGNPTDGITYSINDAWYNDQGEYWNQLAWDTNRYLNIYTNTASGALGYVPDLPQGGIAGSNADRVVLHWATIGRNTPIGPPVDQGRTATHEIGHYLGLDHTFSWTCGDRAACNTTGDLICDTPPHSRPTNGCSDAHTCGAPDPVQNYMNYSDDLCMEEFTFEQARRERCSLAHYRSNLYALSDTTCGNSVVEPGEECDDGETVPGDGCDDRCRFEHVCGDDALEPGEECDDGNSVPGDGCDGACHAEAVPPACGDGIFNPQLGEECDDGNTSSGDGCDSNCRWEAGGSCCAGPHGPGCDDPVVEACVCGQDPFCCNVAWDAQCVGDVWFFSCGNCTRAELAE